MPVWLPHFIRHHNISHRFLYINYNVPFYFALSSQNKSNIPLNRIMIDYFFENSVQFEIEFCTALILLFLSLVNSRLCSIAKVCIFKIVCLNSAISLLRHSMWFTVELFSSSSLIRNSCLLSTCSGVSLFSTGITGSLDGLACNVVCACFALDVDDGAGGAALLRFAAAKPADPLIKIHPHLTFQRMDASTFVRYAFTCL